MFRLLACLLCVSSVQAASICDLQLYNRDVNIDGKVDQVMSSPCEYDNKGLVVVSISTGVGTGSVSYELIGPDSAIMIGSTIEFKQDQASEPPLIIIGSSTRCKAYMKYEGGEMVTYKPPCAK